LAPVALELAWTFFTLPGIGKTQNYSQPASIPIMSSDLKYQHHHDGEKVDRGMAGDVDELQKHNVHQSEVLVDANLMSNAFDAENREHEMGVMEAVKMHPMACFWAFIFCFTIVSPNYSTMRSKRVACLGTIG
jgi:hypothetical protein